MKYYLIAAFLLAPCAATLAQEQPEPSVVPAPAGDPAPSPAPTPETKPEPEPSPATPSEAPSTLTAPTASTTEAAVSPRFADAAAVDRWIETYYQNPEPQFVVEAFRALDAAGVIGRDEAQKYDRSWAYVGFFWACMSENAALMAEWCSTMGPIQEPARTWWWTAVWMSQTDAGNMALREAMELPPGHANRINYKWLADRPINIMQSQVRGRQHAMMLWNAYFATGKDAILYKMFEGFVPAAPKPANTPQQQMVVQQMIEKNKELVSTMRATFAANLVKHPRALETCKKSIERLRDPVKSEIATLVAEAEATLAKESATPEVKPDAAPTGEAQKVVPETPAAPGPETTPPATPDTEKKPETKPETTPETKPQTPPSETPPSEPAPSTEPR